MNDTNLQLKQINNKLNAMSDETNKRLGEMNKRFDGQERAIDLLTRQIEEQGSRFDGQERAIDVLARQMEKQGVKFDGHERQIDLLAQKMYDHEENIQELKTDMTEVKGYLHRIIKTLDDLSAKMNKHDDEITMHSHAISRLHDRDDDIFARIKRLHPEVAPLPI